MAITGNFLCGPEWKVKITTKDDQKLEIKQVRVEKYFLTCGVCCVNMKGLTFDGQTRTINVISNAVGIVLTAGFHKHKWLQINDGPDFRVLISPLPPAKEEKKAKEEVVKKVEVKKAEIKTRIVAQKKTAKRKMEKKIVKVEMKGIDNRLV